MKKKNNGSTLITVVIGVSFLMILAAILLSASSAGLRMKQMEDVAKKNHYSDEQVLSDIYNGIGKVAAECMTRAYTQVLSQVTDSGTAQAVYDDQDKAYRAFSHQFITLLKSDYWPETVQGGIGYDDILLQLRAYITKEVYEAELKSFAKTEVIAGSDGVPYQYAFRDVIVYYKTVDAAGVATGYEAAITTDIVIEIPYINFFRDSSRILDYAMIANQGIYFKNAADRTVEGNIYAGVGESENPDKLLYRDETVPGGLNFYRCDNVTINGAYLISKGDINVRESKVTIGNSGSAANAQVWAESIRTVEDRDKSAAAALAEAADPAKPLADLEISASVYAANDLELNARKSRVKLMGEYYGYGNGVYETQEKINRESGYASANHTNNSSIVINAGQSELDLSELKTLVVAGHAYVDLESRAYLNEPPSSSPSGLLEEFETGESLALKTSQYMYLAPTNCLKTTNPVETALALPEDEVWQGDGNWFGMTGGFVDAGRPVEAKLVENRTTGASYTYYYLRFLPGMEDDYAGTVLNMIDPQNNLSDMDTAIKSKYRYESYNVLQLNQIWEIKQSIAQRAAAAQVETVIVAEDTTAGIYAAGILSRVTASELSSQEIPEQNLLSLDTMSKIKSKMHLRYEWMYAALDPREEFSMASDLLTSPFKAAEDRDFDDVARYKLMPAGEFVDFSKLPGSAVVTSYKYSENRDYKTVLSGSSYTVPAGSIFRGIIICKGDVTVSPGANVDGLIIAGGRIKVEGNGVIRANRSIVQSILDEEMTEESRTAAGEISRSDYASYVLRGFTPSHTTQDVRYRVTGTDYTDYISYQNWRKGEN